MSESGLLRKRRACSVEPLRLVESKRCGSPSIQAILIKENSPWEHYTKIYSIKLGKNDPDIVAEHKGGPSFGLVSIRLRQLSQQQVNLLRAIQHRNFVTIHEIYRRADNWYIVTEHVSRSLQEVVANPFLDSTKLAAIAGQIVAALAYLEQEGLCFESLTCSNVLIRSDGMIKLCNQQDCVQSKTNNTDQLGYLLMELMEGYVKKGGNIGVDDVERWTPEALDFLSATTSASSWKELLQHPFIHSWQMPRLQGLVSFVETWTKPIYRYLAG